MRLNGHPGLPNEERKRARPPRLMIDILEESCCGNDCWLILDANDLGLREQEARTASSAAPKPDDQHPAGAGTEHPREVCQAGLAKKSRPGVRNAQPVDLELTNIFASAHPHVRRHANSKELGSKPGGLGWRQPIEIVIPEGGTRIVDDYSRTANGDQGCGFALNLAKPRQPKNEQQEQ